MTRRHARKIEVKGQVVPKLEWKQTNGRTDGHDRVATFPSNAVSDETRAVGHRRIPFSARVIHVGRIIACTHTPHTHTFNGPFPGLPRLAGTREVNWILLKQETVSGSGIRWAICKSAASSSQITTPVPHHSVFYRPDALPVAQPTASKY